jgi:hypothetical protein
MQFTTPSQYAKSYGFRTLKQVSNMTDVSSETLIRWFSKRRDLFEIVILGCVVQKQLHDRNEAKNGN